MKSHFVLIALCVLMDCSWSEKNSQQNPPDYTLGSIEIYDPWSTGGVSNGAGAAYVTFVNTGAEPDTLLSVSSSACEQAELHEMIEQDGMRKMRSVHHLALLPSVPTVLQPGGTHIMLLSLHESQRKNDTLDLSLAFSRAGTLPVRLPVR